MGQLVAPDKVSLWTPGELTFNDAIARWEHVALRGYRHGSLDVAIPSMRDCMIISYRGSDAAMSRRAGGPWHSEQVGRDVYFLLAHDESLQQKWDRPIDVTHLYVIQAELCRIVGDVFRHSISDVGIEDCVRVEGSILPSLVSAFEGELRSGGLDRSPYRSVLVNQLCTRPLRRYAKTRVQGVPLAVHMADWQRRRLDRYIKDNLDHNLELEGMAGEVGISISGLIRKFRAEFGCSPHACVLRQRLGWARQLLNRSMATPLRCIATDCGFSGQSHLVRHFRRAFEQTPTDYRSTVTGRPLPPPEPDQPSRQRVGIGSLQQPPRDLAAPFPRSEYPVQYRDDREHRSDSRLQCSRRSRV